MKKIAMFLSNAFDPDPRVYMIAKSLVDYHYKVDLFCWDRDGGYSTYENIDGIQVFRFFVPSKHGRGSSQIFFLSLFWLRALKTILLSKRKYDLFYAHDFDTLPLGYFLSKILRKKLVYDSHESYVDMLLNVHPVILKIIFYSENFFIKNSDLVITVGDKLKKYFEKRGAKRVVVVGNWKKIEDYSFDSSQINFVKKELNLHHYKLIVSFIAHLNPERQLHSLLKVISHFSDVCLLIGGKGPLESLVKDYARKFKNIFYLGFVKPKLVPVYTAISDVVFYGFDIRNKNARFSAPNKLFEALAAGRAIISGNFGEIAEITKKENCGLILKDYSVEEISSAIMSLKDNPSLLKTLQVNAKNAAIRRYNWNNARKKLIAGLDELFC